MAKVIVVTSGKGGVGKTTVTVNLGRALAKTGKRVLLADMDFGLNNLDVVAGVENKVVYDVSDVLCGRCRAKQALVRDDYFKTLYVLPSDGMNSSSACGGQNVKLVVSELSPLFDYVFLDSPAGIDVGFHRAVSCSDRAIVVTTPSVPSLRDADKVVSILKSYKLESVGVVVNRARGDLMLDEKMIFPEDIKQMLSLELLGVLPEEDQVFLYSGRALPFSCDSAKAYKMLAETVDKGKKRVFDVTCKYSGFFGSIRRALKKGL